jgi:hypothetical protein
VSTSRGVRAWLVISLRLLVGGWLAILPMKASGLQAQPGGAWTLLSSTPAVVYELGTTPDRPGELLAVGAQLGRTVFSDFYVSPDGGRSWSIRGALRVGHFPSLVSDGRGRIYVVEQGQVRWSTDCGATWNGDNLRGAASLILDSSRENMFYVPGGSYDVVYRSIDRGVSWQELPLPVPCGVSVGSVLPKSARYGVSGGRLWGSQERGRWCFLDPSDAGATAE